MDSTLQFFANGIGNRKIVIFGAGFNGKQIKKIITQDIGMDVYCFVDNYKNGGG